MISSHLSLKDHNMLLLKVTRLTSHLWLPALMKQPSTPNMTFHQVLCKEDNVDHISWKYFVSGISHWSPHSHNKVLRAPSFAALSALLSTTNCCFSHLFVSIIKLWYEQHTRWGVNFWVHTLDDMPASLHHCVTQKNMAGTHLLLVEI